MDCIGLWGLKRYNLNIYDKCVIKLFPCTSNLYKNECDKKYKVTENKLYKKQII